MRQSFRNQKELSLAAKQEKQDDQAWQTILHGLIDSSSENVADILAVNQEMFDQPAKTQKYKVN